MKQTDTAKIQVSLARDEVAELRGLLGNRSARKIIKEAKNFFSYQANGTDNSGDEKAIVQLRFANRDVTEFGAVLRKIEKPRLLKRIFRSGLKREAIEFLEQVVGTAVSQVRFSRCEHYEDCLNFVLTLKSEDDARTKYEQIAEQEEICLGFACVECPHYRLVPEPRIFTVKQPFMWEAMLGNFIFETA